MKKLIVFYFFYVFSLLNVFSYSLECINELSQDHNFIQIINLQIETLDKLRNLNGDGRHEWFYGNFDRQCYLENITVLMSKLVVRYPLLADTEFGTTMFSEALKIRTLTANPSCASQYGVHMVFCSWLADVGGDWIECIEWAFLAYLECAEPF